MKKIKVVRTVKKKKIYNIFYNRLLEYCAPVIVHGPEKTFSGPSHIPGLVHKEMPVE